MALPIMLHTIIIITHKHTYVLKEKSPEGAQTFMSTTGIFSVTTDAVTQRQRFCPWNFKKRKREKKKKEAT